MPNKTSLLHKDKRASETAAPHRAQPYLKLVSGSADDHLTKKEQEACNRATD